MIPATPDIAASSHTLLLLTIKTFLALIVLENTGGQLDLKHLKKIV